MTDIPGTWNFRDVASNVNSIYPRRLFRSGELTHVNFAGQNRIAQLGLTDVIDLRTRQERQQRGLDAVPDCITLHFFPFVDSAFDQTTSHEGVFHRLLAQDLQPELFADTAYQYMVSEYQNFPLLSGTHKVLSALVEMLIDKKSILVHCLAGKDRTGFIIAIILQAIDIDHETILADYLKSNQATDYLRTKIVHTLQSYPAEVIPPELLEFTQSPLSDVILGVCPEYLDAAYSSIQTHFGSLHNYLATIGIDNKKLNQLGASLLL